MEKSKIGEISDRTGLTLRALRFYEIKGLIAPERQGTTRLYSPADEARLLYIRSMTDAGVPLATVAKALEMTDAGESPNGMLSMVIFELEAEARRRLDAISALRKTQGIR